MGRTIRVFAILFAITLAHGAAAVTFTSPASYSTFGLTPVPGGEPAVLDTANGFVFTGDLRLNVGGQAFFASRAFTVGPLPEQISVSASENWKIVVSGGGAQDVAPTLSVSTAWYILDILSTESAAALGSSLTQVGNGYGVVSEPSHALVFGSDFPANQILTPGNYQMQVLVGANFIPGTPAGAFSEGAYIEFGGMTSFDGFSVEVSGTPVPEPATALLLVTGLLGLGVRRRWR